MKMDLASKKIGSTKKDPLYYTLYMYLSLFYFYPITCSLSLILAILVENAQVFGHLKMSVILDMMN